MIILGPDQRTGYKKMGVIEGYDKWASTYDREHNPLIALEEKVTLELIEDVKGKSVLDLGCGTGRYCVILAERGASVVGVDPSSEMLEHAKRKVTSTHRFDLRQGTIETISFPSDHFDLVISALTLSHLPELEPTFREMVRVLKWGGSIVISDIHPYWPVSGHDYAEFFDEAGREYRIPEYPHLFEEYWRLCIKYGVQFEDLREPKIDSGLIDDFPSLKDFFGVPLAMNLKLKKVHSAVPS
ncbi:MAG: class I SAM-dependent methyltransferase [Candidatus Bathyarchaeota archaeon]|nr:class I SAM-dependent methyltransferase [Candidatus Bathyarchaeota archaeon]